MKDQHENQGKYEMPLDGDFKTEESPWDKNFVLAVGACIVSQGIRF